MSALTDEEIKKLGMQGDYENWDDHRYAHEIIAANNAKVLKDLRPVFQLKWNSRGDARYTVSEPNIGDTDVYSADQVAALVQERDAALARMKELESSLEDARLDAAYFAKTS